MTVYILFQTDIYKSKASRVCFGLYSSEVRAIYAAKMKGLYTNDAEVVIIECEMDKFGEV